MSEQENQEQAAGTEKQFVLQKIYLKDTSFETPNSPEIFTEEWKPEINIDLQTSGKQVAEHVHEVVLTVTVTAKIGEKTAYLMEVHQAGVFGIAGFNAQEQSHMLGSYCPSLLFPYAREAVSSLIGKGGFPQMLMAPVNFDALYAQHMQQQAAAASSNSEEPVH